MASFKGELIRLLNQQILVRDVTGEETSGELVDIGEDYFVILSHGKRVLNNYCNVISVEELVKEKA